MMETQHWSHLDSIDISAGNDYSDTLDQSAGQGIASYEVKSNRL